MSGLGEHGNFSVDKKRFSDRYINIYKYIHRYSCILYNMILAHMDISMQFHRRMEISIHINCRSTYY